MIVKGQQIQSSVGGTNVVFWPLEIAGSRKVDGYEFPLALELSNSSQDPLTVDEAAKAIRDVSEKGIITDLLNKHGGLLIRGVHEVQQKPSRHWYMLRKRGEAVSPMSKLVSQGAGQ
jgi:hypothetical protein